MIYAKIFTNYVEQVRIFAKEMTFPEAVEQAVDYCIQNGIRADFLSGNRAEAIAMSIFEYNEEQHLRSERDDCIPVKEAKFTILIGWFGLFFFGAVFALTFFAFDINNAEEFGPFVVAAGFFGLVTLAFLLMVITVHRHRLMLYEDYFVYTPYFARPQTYSYGQIYKLSLAKQSYRLYSPQGKCLAAFEDNMENVPLALDFLKSKGVRIEV